MKIHPISNHDSAFAVLKEFEGVYFTTVVEDGNPDIICSDDNGPVIKIHVGGFADNQINLSYLKIFDMTVDSGYYRMPEIIETANALIFMGKLNQDEAAPLYPFIIITKDDAGATCVFYHPIGTDSPFSGIPNLKKYYLMTSTAPTLTLRDAPYTTDTSYMTTAVPMVVEGCINYTPNLKFLVQKQYIITGAIMLGSDIYWTDGQIAIKD